MTANKDLKKIIRARQEKTGESYTTARLGEVDVARRHINEAVKLEPGNKNFWTNKGWYHLMKGELDEANQALSKARQLKKGDPVVDGNIQVLKYIRRHGGTYWDYLERPLDRNRIDRLAVRNGIR